MSKHVTRRGFFRGVGVATAGAAVLSTAVLTTGVGVAQAAVLPQPLDPGSFDPGSARAHFAGLVGQRMHGAIVESAEAHLGGVALLLRDDGGERFQVDVLRSVEGDPRGVRSAAGLDFFLANRGDGRAPSFETHGRSLMAVATWCEAQGAPPMLMGWTERHHAFPNGAFLVC